MRFKVAYPLARIKNLAVSVLLIFVFGNLFSCVTGKKEPQGTANQESTTNAVIPVPEENRFVRTVLAEGLREPMELTVTPKGDVFWIERKGVVYFYNRETKKSVQVASLDVFTGNNDGLLGITLDPDFSTNKFVYLYFSAPGDVPKQHLSRFVFDEQNKALISEIVVLQVPTQRQECCHSGGALAFGPDGNLYIGVGDNTSPKVQDGYSPLDERPGRAAFDAQGTSANTNDLRGKVLRIHPEKNGTYTIPEGNLFPKDGSKGRPEIYVMGARNPIRLSVDAKTGYLYFGDIGPDANTASTRGPEAYDEINLAKKPGNYGWPYFVADNKGYPKYDFATDAIGALNNPDMPVNNSPHNTGAKILPPAQKPMIWYSYNDNPLFPNMGKGGRSAMAGPVYRYNAGLTSANKFPEYYDNTLFIHDWMRDWIKAVKLDAQGNLKSMEEFMPGTKFSSPMDLEFGQDGTLYVLEYGKGWYSENPDAKLVRISYVSGSRPPVVQATASVVNGAVPLRVQFSAEGTKDLDGDALTYQWQLQNTDEVTSREPNPTFVYEKPGIYKAKLTVSDSQGLKTEETIEIIAGNTQPQVNISLQGNTSFYWPTEKLKYQVQVQDAEDGTLASGKIKPADVPVFLEYAAGGANLSPMLTAQRKETAAEAELLNHPGKLLMDDSDCKNCHAPDKSSIGPSYRDIALRYHQDASALNRLAAKIIKGGSGAWDRNFVMVGHPSLSPKAAAEMVKYIYTFAEEKPKPRRLEPTGTLTLKAPTTSSDNGSFYLMASYTDKGTPATKPLSASAFQVLKSPKIQAENYDGFSNTFTSVKIIGKLEDGDSRYLGEIQNRAFIYFKDLDLTHVGQLALQYTCMVPGTVVEARLNSAKGELIGTLELPLTADTKNWQQAQLPLKAVSGRQHIYLVFLNNKGGRNILNLDWIYFKPAMLEASSKEGSSKASKNIKTH